MKVEPTEGKIIRIVERTKTKYHHESYFYIIESDDGKQYEFIDESRTQYYQLGDIILASSWSQTYECFYNAKIVKTNSS